MRIQLRGESVVVTDALRAHVEKKVDRLDKYFEGEGGPPIEASVVLLVFRGRHRAEITLTGGQRLLRSEVGSKDMYGSIDAAVDKIERQIHKYKTRENRKPRQDEAMSQQRDQEQRLQNMANGTTDEAHSDEFKIVRVKRFGLKPMSPEEAVLQMDLVGHTFFVFTDDKTGGTHVVYKRHDGSYGLIHTVED